MPGDPPEHDTDLEADGCEDSSLEAITALGVVASGFFCAPTAAVACAGDEAYNERSWGAVPVVGQGVDLLLNGGPVILQALAFELGQEGAVGGVAKDGFAEVRGQGHLAPGLLEAVDALFRDRLVLLLEQPGEDFDILQVYNALDFKIKDLPVRIFSDFAVNLADRTPDPLDRNNAYEYGLKVGNAKKKGDWETGYYYAYVEPNAVVGAFAESDFGAGHADKRGSVTYLRYGLTDYLKLQLKAYFANNITGADDETRRFQTDLEWVF